MSAFEPEPFGKYYLVDKIATGGMAEIFKAKTYSHGGFENLLVIKRILAHHSDNEDFIEMFIDEAKVSVALQHTNIIRIYDFGKIADNYFIAMECVEGKDTRNLLRKLAQRRKFLPVEFAAYVAHEVCKGLDCAHNKTDVKGLPYGIVHRDVSPSNVLVSYGGDVKIADFGIAKAESNAYSTRDGVLKGKFEYMSPEQAAGEEIDHRSDVFSLGIILWEMLTGRRLFKTDSEPKTLERIKRAEVDPPSVLNPRVPARLEQIVMRALERDRTRRYQHAREMQDDLMRFLFPATPDVVREALSRFMQTLFEDEIAEERDRLEQGSHIAQQLYFEGPDLTEEWEGRTSTSMSAVTGVRRAWPALIAIPILVILLLGVVGAVLAVVGVSLWQAPEPVEVVAPTTGSLVVVMAPPGRIHLDGVLAAEGSNLELSEVEPGTHTIRLEADGYQALEGEVEVRAGELASFTRTLEAIEVEEAPPVEPPRVRFESSPGGATVFVDGRVVGRTPFTWSGATPGRAYRVEYELGGHRRASGSLEAPDAGGQAAFSLELDPVQVAPGQVSIALIGGGWAKVWVDGQEQEQTAPLSGLVLPAGIHTIRVANPDLGIDSVHTVEVPSGGVATVRVRPQ